MDQETDEGKTLNEVAYGPLVLPVCSVEDGWVCLREAYQALGILDLGGVLDGALSSFGVESDDARDRDSDGEEREDQRSQETSRSDGSSGGPVVELHRVRINLCAPANVQEVEDPSCVLDIACTADEQPVAAELS